MNRRKILVGVGLAIILILGFVQVSTEVQADPPLDQCAAVLCLACPQGTVPAPVPGNCCRCVRAGHP